MVTLFLAAVWVTGIGGTLWGTWYALRQIHRDVDFPELPPISILKPVKGMDAGLRQNLTGFFHLNYPAYELIFAVDSPNDPAKTLIEELIAAHPDVPSRLVVGDRVSAANPKVNNLLQAYAQAKYDTLLISDSNVRVSPGYLFDVVSVWGNDVGIVTAVVAGVEPSEWGGYLEATYLNTFYARWMYMAQAFGFATVVGKSMLFRKSTLERLGGIQTLGCYIAEDYMAGRAMYHLGMKVAIMPAPVSQYIGKYSFQDFWQRHIRWGRIRKSHAPIAFAFEPIFMALFSGVVGALAAQRLGYSFGVFFALHALVWFASDCILMKATDTLRPFVFASWLARELLALPQWIHTALGRSVLWRGSRLTLFPGGFLGMFEEQR